MTNTTTSTTATATAVASASASSSVRSSDPERVRAWLSARHPREAARLSRFEIGLRLGRLGPDRRSVTRRTVELLRALVGGTRWETAARLLLLLRGVGRAIHAAGGFREPAIGNVVRRIMCAVRDEALNTANDAAASAAREKSDLAGDANKHNSNLPPMTRNMSLSTMMWAHTTPQRQPRPPNRRLRAESAGSFDDAAAAGALSSLSAPLSSIDDDDDHDPYADSLPSSFREPASSDLKERVMEAIQETLGELEDMYKAINDQAVGHVHSDEVVLVLGHSKTIELFVKAAAARSRRPFRVVVAEGAPRLSGRTMAKALRGSSCRVTLIHDAAVCAVMPRVDRVLLSAHAVLADGGLVAPAGGLVAALAARECSVPVVCVTGIFKLCPTFPHEGQDTMQDLEDPGSIVDYEEAESYGQNGDDGLVEFVNPVHDYVPPSLVELYLTNVGGFQPSYVYRLLAEYYHTDDWEDFE